MALSLTGKKAGGGAVGLDLDGTFVAAVRASDDGVALAASTDLEPGVMGEGEVRDPDALAAALRDFFKRHALPGRVHLGVSNQEIVVRQMELPRIEDQKQLMAAIRFQAAETIPMPLDEAILDYQVIGNRMGSDGSPRLQLIVVAAREAMVSRLLGAVRAAGLKPEGIDLSAFALVCVLASAFDLGDTARVFCHLGGVTNLAVAVGRSCLFSRPLSTAWDDGAEHMAAALAEEIRLSIDYYTDQPEAPRVGEVVLSGPGSSSPGLVDELGALVGLPVAVANPLGELRSDGLPDGEDPARHTVAAGLALGAAA